MRVFADRGLSLSRLAAVLCSLATAAVAEDGRGLKRGADPSQVSISGLSSGAAMAVQYAVAHSGSVTAVGAVAGPQWGCAGGSLSRAVNDCMCGRSALTPTIDTARGLAASGAIDGLVLAKPQSLSRSWIFQSPADETVSPRSSKADAAFLADFIGTPPEVDQGNAVDGSDRAGHGIIAPDGTDACAYDGSETSFVRRCGEEDNAGKMLHALYGPGSPYTPSERAADVPGSELWTFDQRHLIEKVKSSGASVSSDYYNPFWLWWPDRSPRRRNFDMASTGYIYVPPSCRSAGSACHVHVALHGCKQDAKRFARKAGYNEWAEHYRTIIVYPAIAPSEPVPGPVCHLPPVDQTLDASSVEPNPNGCWDWWGYLDTASEKGRYLTKTAPQIRVLESLIAEVTAPAAP
ncbi:extracellular catalytic domain type 2 short-chain-length polyhydroxyalkanoate depolymerase [Methylobacterium nigriterrae]|uniref:extracellular catalytic domain type 2 short-chain-length polyhydroxyalkanoate depolymerase n=1 Tax=Methylobacterium nigriterrae TaxID=3127512 RepID=UPI003013434F